MKTKQPNLFKRLFFLCICVVALVCFGAVTLQNNGGRYETKMVSADYGDVMKIEAYDVKMQVHANRSVTVQERITVQFLTNGNMFYRSLPTDGCRYENFTASCNGNPDFSYYVADNPDMDGFIDVNCEGGVRYGQIWVYDIAYTMLDGEELSDAQTYVDVIGFGWSVPLHEVTAEITFPQAIVGTPKIYAGGFGATGTDADVTYATSADKKSVSIYAPCLEVVHNDTYQERMAQGITLGFSLPEGTFEPSNAFTARFWTVAGIGVALFAVAVVIGILTHKKREITPIVNVKPPKGMDPLKMGKWLDGTADNEDVSAMIYYFADAGYLKIDLTNEKDPKLIALVDCLPAETPIYQKTLFNGLFAKASTVSVDQTAVFEELPKTQPQKLQKEIQVSQLATHYFQTAQDAAKQVPSIPMYGKSSVVAFFGGCVMAVLFGFFAPFILGRSLGGGYVYWLGIIFALPIVAFAILGWLCENYRYKWKGTKRTLIRLLQVILFVGFAIFFVVFCANFFMTTMEKIAVSVGTMLLCYATHFSISRTQEYTQTLGDILGFKEFITVTEEDKIKEMLAINPELYYRVLPYAQVLGVTDEWEKKFKALTLEPPAWCVYNRMTVFDYLLINRCMRISMAAAYTKAMQSSRGGGHIGAGGGGGHFGGFGGGGFGGGGGGVR